MKRIIPSDQMAFIWAPQSWFDIWTLISITYHIKKNKRKKPHAHSLDTEKNMTKFITHLWGESKLLANWENREQPWFPKGYLQKSHGKPYISGELLSAFSLGFGTREGWLEIPFLLKAGLEVLTRTKSNKMGKKYKLGKKK